MNTLKISAMMLGMVGVLAICTTTTNAEARDHDNRVAFGIDFGGPRYCPQPVVARQYVPGHYETQYQTVLAEPARIERRWVPAVEETRRDHHGRLYSVIVREGYWTEYRLPARYETRVVQVWVPGYYQEVPVAAPLPAPRPRINIGGIFNF